MFPLWTGNPLFLYCNNHWLIFSAGCFFSAGLVKTLHILDLCSAQCFLPSPQPHSSVQLHIKQAGDIYIMVSKPEAEALLLSFQKRAALTPQKPVEPGIKSHFWNLIFMYVYSFFKLLKQKVHQTALDWIVCWIGLKSSNLEVL